MKRVFQLAVLIFLPVFSLSAIDVGVMLDQNSSVDIYGSNFDNFKDNFSYSAKLTPWFTVPLGLSDGSFGKFYFSAAVTAKYEGNNWGFVPELMRTEILYQTEGGLGISAGRINYSDPLGFIANGFFDGARVSLNFGRMGTFGAGVWYTGLLYRETTEIYMTKEDDIINSAEFSYANFADTYFASRRLLAALDWEKPASELLDLNVALLGQIDLNGNDDRLHTQYLAAKASIPFGDFVFSLGAALGLSEFFTDSDSEDVKDAVNLTFAWELAIGWLLPTSIQDQLTLIGRFSSGTLSDDSTIAAFIPITRQAQGSILQAKLSGLSVIQLDYTARLHKTLSINLAGAYFILSDLGTYSGYAGKKDGHFLGSEFSGRLIWAPASDLIINFGGGAFLPSLGNSDSEQDVKWKLELSASLMIF